MNEHNTINPQYVYAIVASEDQFVLDVPGIEGQDDVVTTPPDNGLVAVVSPVTQSNYSYMSRKEAAHFLMAHQRVTEALIAHGQAVDCDEYFSILPVKFGTVLPDEARVHYLLTRGSVTFRAALERVRGLSQMELLVLWDLQSVFQEIRHEQSILDLVDRTIGQPLEATVTDRIMIGQMVKSSLEKRRIETQSQIVNELRGVAQDSVINPLMDDSMVLNLALLLNDGGREILYARLDKLDDLFGDTLTFRCVGPLPPYSFATVEVQVPTFDAIDEARHCLELGEIATFGEVKRRYRCLAGKAHPDHCPDDPQATLRVMELKQASKLLTSYAESQMMQAIHFDGMCDFRQPAVERTLIISVKRQEA
jgi:hypothetical protein